MIYYAILQRRACFSGGVSPRTHWQF